jgi:general secretion pathway protein N
MRLFDRFRTRHRSAVTTLLVALQLLIGALIAGRLWTGTGTTDLLAERELRTASASDDWSRPERPVDLGVLESRPLFHPSRRPPNETADVAAEPSRPPLRIVGTMLFPGRPAVGLLTRDGGDTLRVRLGDDVDGWVVREIAARRVVLARGDEQVEIGVEDAPRVGAIASAVAERGDKGGAPVRPPTTAEPRLYRPPPR